MMYYIVRERILECVPLKQSSCIIAIRVLHVCWLRSSVGQTHANQAIFSTSHYEARKNITSYSLGQERRVYRAYIKPVSQNYWPYPYDGSCQQPLKQKNLRTYIRRPFITRGV